MIRCLLLTRKRYRMSENNINTENSDPSTKHEEELRNPPSRKPAKPVDQAKLKKKLTSDPRVARF